MADPLEELDEDLGYALHEDPLEDPRGEASGFGLYFAYGSNMSLPRLRERLREADHIATASVENFRLVFNKPSRDGSGKANLVPHAGARSWGVVWRIRSAAWPVLDGFEPGYARRIVRVRAADGPWLSAATYLHPARGPEIPPFDWYVDHLLHGARAHGLPGAWIERLLAARRRSRRDGGA